MTDLALRFSSASTVRHSFYRSADSCGIVGAIEKTDSIDRFVY